MMMIMVKSSQIKAIGYDNETSELYVAFNNSTTYKYSNVPYEVYEKMLASESIGKFLGAFIKGKYEYVKVI